MMNQKMLPYGASPVNVVDISAVFQMEQIIDDNLDKLRAPQMMMMYPPPPMDTITTTTSSDETDSVTSLSTGSPDQEDYIAGSTRSLPASFTATAVPKRSIFSSYWDKTGEKPVKPQSPNRALLHQRRQRVVVASHENTEDKGYFSQVPSVEDTVDSSSSSCSSSCSSPSTSAAARSSCHGQEPPSPRTRRRSIFGSTPLQLDSSTRSLPTLAMNNEFEEVVRSAAPSPLGRKARSSSTLEGKHLPSCLRSRRQRQSSSTSVSFDEKIDVVIFQKPQEQHSELGWEQLFTV